FSAFPAVWLCAAVLCAVAVCVLARRYAFSPAGRLGWAVCGFLFGWVGLALMAVLHDWPARVPCPRCEQPRRVDRDHCEHCGADHAVAAADGTEVFEETASEVPAQCV